MTERSRSAGAVAGKAAAALAALAPPAVGAVRWADVRSHPLLSAVAFLVCYLAYDVLLFAGGSSGRGRSPAGQELVHGYRRN